MTAFLSQTPELRGERGAVLPLAMLVLSILSAVLISFALMTGQEPLVASNHVALVQAQALAEAGLQRALWALSTPDAPDGGRWVLPAPPPYDASRLVTVTTPGGAPLGGFRVEIVGMGDRQRQVHVTGLVPGIAGPLGQARREVTATAIRLRFPSPPAGLTVRGDLVVGAGVVVDAISDGSCGELAGTWSGGTTILGPGSDVRGGSVQAQPAEAFDARAFDAAELNALRAVARVRGAYYRGPVRFDASQPIPGGLVFVDMATGAGPSEATPEADAASIGEGATGAPGGAFRGWLVVNGSLSISGNVTLQGMVWAAGRLHQSGGARLIGAAIAGDAGGGSPSLIEAHPPAGPALTWSCETARTGGRQIPDTWMVKPGSYREAAG